MSKETWNVASAERAGFLVETGICIESASATVSDLYKKEVMSHVNVYAFMPVVPIHVLSDFQLSMAINLGVRISKIAVGNILKFQQLCVEANKRYLT
jgi:hypothetical protein